MQELLQFFEVMQFSSFFFLWLENFTAVEFGDKQYLIISVLIVESSTGNNKI